MTSLNQNLLIAMLCFIMNVLVLSPTNAQVSNATIAQIEHLLTAAESTKRSNPEQAIMDAQQALSLAKREDLMEYQIKANIKLGWTHSLLQKYPKATEYYEVALAAARAINNQDLELEAWVDWAFLFERAGDYDKAINELLVAQQLAQQLGNQKQMAKIYSNIARVYFNYKDIDKAIEFLNKSKVVFEKLGEHEMLSSLYNNLAILYKNRGNNEKAITSFKQAVSTSLVLKDTLGAAQSYNNLGFLYTLENKLDTAEQYLLNALEIFEHFGQENPFTNHYLGKLNYTQKEVELAKKYALKAAALFEARDMKKEEMGAKELLSQIYALAGDFEIAYNYQLALDKDKEELFKLDKSKAVELIENKYALQEKELALLAINQQNERRKFALIGLVGFGLFSLTLGWLFFRQRRLQHKKAQLLLEQRLLRSQMKPHFIFNALSSIQGFIFKNDTKTAGTYLAKFSRLIRMVLENSRREYVPLVEEITSLENYLDLQQLRFPDKFEYEIKVDEEIDAEEMAIPPLMAQPFIENAVEHGIQHNEKKGFLSIRFTWGKAGLQFLLEDNGIGRTQAATLKEQRIPYQSLSTQITKERLHVYQHKTQKHFNLEVKDRLNQQQQIIGTSVFIQLPFTKWIAGEV